jgi:putative FmdB family regulatory protein
MPIYEYICSECKSKFEQMRPLSQAGQVADCPRCHKPARRKMSTFAAFTTSVSGVPKTVSGTSGSSCSGCSSGSCSTCAS